MPGIVSTERADGGVTRGIRRAAAYLQDSTAERAASRNAASRARLLTCYPFLGPPGWRSSSLLSWNESAQDERRRIAFQDLPPVRAVFDCRRLGDVLHHDEPDHEPLAVQSRPGPKRQTFSVLLLFAIS